VGSPTNRFGVRWNFERGFGAGIGSVVARGPFPDVAGHSGYAERAYGVHVRVDALHSTQSAFRAVGQTCSKALSPRIEPFLRSSRGKLPFRLRRQAPAVGGAIC